MYLKILLMCTTLIACGQENLPQNIPSSLSWANIDTNKDGVFEDYVSSIKLQPCQDCYIYAAVGLLEIQYKIENGFGFDLNLSEQNIHNCMKIDCVQSGDSINILKYVKQYGVLQELNSPSGVWRACENCSSSVPQQYLSFRKFHDLYFEGKNTKEEEKQILIHALQKGPVITYVNSWLGLKIEGDVHYCAYPERRSGHLVVVVGYENFGEILLVKNSHGEKNLIKIALYGECGVASDSYAVSETYLSWNLGNSFCSDVKYSDSDGITDALDNCPSISNSDQSNQDSDTFGDPCDRCPQDSRNSRYCL